jgi:hypothetical protein
MSWLTEAEMQILRDCQALLPEVRKIHEQLTLLQNAESQYYTSTSKRLTRIEEALKDLTEPPTNNPVAFEVTETAIGENTMALPKKAATATADLVILDDGKGVLYTLQPINKAGAPVPLPTGSGPISAVSSAPASLANAVQDPGDPTATPPRPPDTTGLVFLATVPQPPVDATGVIMTFSDTLTNGSVISTAATGVDVTPDNSPAGFTITETAE